MKFNLINLVTNKNKKRKSRYKKKGFTLIELTVVLAIMALMITVIAPNFKGVKDNASSKMDEQNCITIKRAIEMLLADDTIPDSLVLKIDPSGNNLIADNISATTGSISDGAKNSLANILYDLEEPHSGEGFYTATVSNGRVDEVSTGTT